MCIKSFSWEFQLTKITWELIFNTKYITNRRYDILYQVIRNWYLQHWLSRKKLPNGEHPKYFSSVRVPGQNSKNKLLNPNYDAYQSRVGVGFPEYSFDNFSACKILSSPYIAFILGNNAN